jgi:hypothetical protein
MDMPSMSEGYVASSLFRQFMQNFLPKMNIGVSVIKPNDFAALNEALDKHKVRQASHPHSCS